MIKIIIDYQVESFERLFSNNYDFIESIYFKKFIRNNINNMSFMFYNCCCLTSLNLSNFNTNNVNDMRSMFSGLNKNCKVISIDHEILNQFKYYN